MLLVPSAPWIRKRTNRLGLITSTLFQNRWFRMATASATVCLAIGWASVFRVMRRMVTASTSIKIRSITCGSNWYRLSRLQRPYQLNRLHKLWIILSALHKNMLLILTITLNTFRRSSKIHSTYIPASSYVWTEIWWQKSGRTSRSRATKSTPSGVTLLHFLVIKYIAKREM